MSGAAWKFLGRAPVEFRRSRKRRMLETVQRAMNDTPQIGIHRGIIAIEGKRADGGCRIGTDAGQREQPIAVARQFTKRYDGNGEIVQSQRA